MPVQGLGNWTKVATPSASVRSILVARTCYRFKTKMRSQLNKAPTGLKLLGVGFSLHLLTTAFGPRRQLAQCSEMSVVEVIAEVVDRGPWLRQLGDVGSDAPSLVGRLRRGRPMSGIGV